ncbi:hypothetical protein SAEN111111_06230 [Saccharibacillus endophyticus]
MGGRAVWSRFGRVLKMGNFDWTLIVSFPIFKGERQRMLPKCFSSKSFSSYTTPPLPSYCFQGDIKKVLSPLDEGGRTFLLLDSKIY